MSTIGSRIKEERERLGLSQTDFANMTGDSSHVQASYESNQIAPEGLYLQKITRHGCDTLYIITGYRRRPINISTDEQELIENYRAMNEASRLKIQAVGDTFTYSKVSRNVANNYDSKL
ncbi:XRE family transcriptional regulator [Xenorhabdus bovienii]|uniref:XRE family transcriptional regulator n=1 Tax=Xenorhabdus bovienii TaxID=40576 RepID=UPI0023B209CD|nr:XRE family transcriptional regulator [Xenorhabdus bovienii]MDE9487244.1 XRE family transcriptional regulator [Xenorhabdus bovienii]